MLDSDQSKTKRHCMIVHAYYPLGETRVERETLALVDAGYEVDVICLKHKRDPKFQTINGVNIYHLPVSRKRLGGFIGQFLEYLLFFIMVFFKLLTLFPRRRYQTVQAHNLPDFLIFSAVLPKLFGARLILDLHDLMPEFFATKSNLSIDSMLVRLVIFQEQMACRFADHVITVTKLWRQRLIDRGVKKEKVSVVMNLPDERYFSAVRGRKEKIRDYNGLRLIYHGTFKEHYGLRELILAIGLVRDQIPGIHLTLQGVGEFSTEMKNLVNELGLQNEIDVNDFALLVSKLPELIHQSDIGVVPNQNDVFTGDLLPTKMMEYIALGMPVIAAKTRVISQYFSDDQILFFSPGDENSLAEKIIYASNHWDEMVARTKTYHQFTSMYNWGRVSKLYVELIDSLGSGKTSKNIKLVL